MAETRGGGAITPPAHLSATAIQTLWQCPLKFLYSKIEKRPEPPSEALVQGSFVHAIFENLFHRPAAQRTHDECRAIARSLWDGGWEAKVNALRLSAKDKNQLQWKVRWVIDNYFKMEDPTKIEPSGIEYKIKSAVAGVTIFGVIDRWQNEDGQLVISDYKTGKVPAREEWKADKEFQVMLYVVMMEDQKKLPVKRGELLYVSAGEIQEVIPTDQARGLAREQVGTAWADIKRRCAEDDFSPQTSALCSYCSFKQVCPAWK